MTRVERLQTLLAKRFPHLEVTLDRPANEAGNWFLDVAAQRRLRALCSLGAIHSGGTPSLRSCPNRFLPGRLRRAHAVLRANRLEPARVTFRALGDADLPAVLD